MNTQEPRNESAGVAGQYAEVWQRAWEPYLRMFQQFTPPGTGLTGLGKLQQRYLEFVSSEGAAAYRKLSQLSADYYAALLNTGVNLSEEFYRQVYQTQMKPPQAAPVPRPVAPARELVFAGPIGSTASRSFVISNRANQPAKVSFELSEFVKEHGPEKVRLDAQLTPSSLELPGQSERTIDCSVPLSEALEPGREYRAVLRVVGFPDMKIGLLVKAESAPRVKAEPAKARAATTRRRKKRKG
jgi:hypothetical protein